MASPSHNVTDVLIIGSGPAGHAAAVSIAQNIHSIVVFDSQEYRNERATHMHMVPTLDGKHPQEFREAAKENTTNHYDFISFIDTRIAKAEKEGKLFIVRDAQGFAECWARSIFHCLFCFGYEQRGSASSGILTADTSLPPPLYIHVARNALQLSESVTTLPIERITFGTFQLSTIT
ncbi:hypothetical protein BU23DRAFT_563092 [Bimuria novae-zelandiae CBS 107.79]|uniref:FAD/NAD(P)-binding domain-containing protein n=1 Tax=Bimuria novae-zelandiae CBS 107.79 TaxID=1447943 RepID=A0A6A5VSI4_9PLEO|nr:hypothetical protein BU23DRAFT_563092 [Bimuria novae-zelandiae CBS 107.79]